MSSLINICNLERFATHDGPGIRTVVFFQGCPIRCPWCANPESQNIGPHLMYEEKKCVHCHSCEIHCPAKAILFDNEHFTWKEELCRHCEACAENCLQNAISFAGEPKSIEDIMKEIQKDNDYYEASKGGVTISGGEAFLQFDALMGLLKACKEQHYHVTIETCGQYPTELLKQAYPYIDVFYFDIKHIDEAVYNKTVKGNLNQVMENMQYLTSQNPEHIVFRVPVIPGFNYDYKTLTGILDLAELHRVKEVHFLPYHTLGKVKYDKLMKPYLWSTDKITEEDLIPYSAYAKTKGITLKIGG